MVDDAVAIAVFPEFDGHFEVDAGAASGADVIRVGFLFGGFDEGVVGLEHGLGDLGAGGVEGKLGEDGSFLAEGVGVDEEDALGGFFAVDDLGPVVGVGFEVELEAADHEVGPGGGGEVCGGFLVFAGLEDEDALVGGGEVEGEAEGGEVGEGWGGLFGRVFFGDGVQFIGEAGAASEDLSGSATAAGEAGFAIGGEDAEGGVLEAAAEVGADDLLVFLGAVGVDADADEVAGGADDVLVAELTVLRLGVAGSEDAGDAAALGGDGHEEDGFVGAFGFGEALFELGIPGDAGVAEGEVGLAEVGGAGTLCGGGEGEGEEEGEGFHRRGNLGGGGKLRMKCEL